MFNEDQGNIPIYDIGLSNRSTNALARHGVLTAADMMTMSSNALSRIPNLGRKSVMEIVRMQMQIKRRQSMNPEPAGDPVIENVDEPVDSPTFDPTGVPVKTLFALEEYHDDLLQYVQNHDKCLKEINFSQDTEELLRANGLITLSSILFSDIHTTRRKKWKPNREITRYLDCYLARHAHRIAAFCIDHTCSLWDDNDLRMTIKEVLDKKPLTGMTYEEIQGHCSIPPAVTPEKLYYTLQDMVEDGALCAEGEYYTIRYPGVVEYLATCQSVNERDCACIAQRIRGDKLRSIGTEYGLTRERIRQIIRTGIPKVQRAYNNETGMAHFAEDRFRYLMTEYAFEPGEAAAWFGISPETVRYLEMAGVQMQGTKRLEEGVSDPLLPAWLRERAQQHLRDCLQRDFVILDGQTVKNSRDAIEVFLLRKIGSDSLNVNAFPCMYNEYLREAGVPFDAEIYCKENRASVNRLINSRYTLCKTQRRARYYNIDARDYTELYETLGLAAYENVEMSTAKLFRDFPDLMQKYDIRDHYELHNLLRKTLPEGSYHQFRCGKMPNICFGECDKISEFIDLIRAHSPITKRDLIDLIWEEFGFDKETVYSSYMAFLRPYFHDGVYTVQEDASAESQQAGKQETDEREQAAS